MGNDVSPGQQETLAKYDLYARAEPLGSADVSACSLLSSIHTWLGSVANVSSHGRPVASANANSKLNKTS